MFQASSCPSSGATKTAVAASGLPSGLGGSSAVGRGRADSWECLWCLFSTTHSSLLRLIVRSGLDVPTFATRRPHACHHARVPSGGRWNCGREMSGKFCLNTDFHVTFRDLLHAVKLRHGTDGFTSPPKEGVLRIFSPWKIRRVRPGANPRTWVPLDHRTWVPLDHRTWVPLDHRTWVPLDHRTWVPLDHRSRWLLRTGMRMPETC